MKKSVLKGIVCVAVFILSLFIIGMITNKGNTDMTVEMDPAEYPLVYMELDGMDINSLHGYGGEMQIAYLRDTITPIGEDRTLRFRLERFNSSVQGLSFEVRSADGKRLVESTKISGYKEEGGSISAEVTLKDLIDQDLEYNFILKVETKDSGTIRYYTRVIQSGDYHAAEKAAFARDFHSKTFSKDKSIAKYLESNQEGDNTTYHEVNINSSFAQITWGELSVTKVTEPVIDIKELGSQTASITMDYYVELQENFYHVKEFYRVRYGTERMYLLDFERKMNQFFDAEKNVFINNKIQLGISDENMELKESEDGNVIAFDVENSLYCYNMTDNKCVRLFSFYDKENGDARTLYDKHDMKVLSVEETGNVRFMVYGYMNRGRHEGLVGIQFYYYNSILNTIEEDVFINYDKSYDLLREYVNQLAYVSKTNEVYLMLDNTIFQVNLTEKTGTVIAGDLKENTYEVSEDNVMIVWQKGTEKYNSESLVLMNLNTKKQTEIPAGEGKYIAPLGFMNNDLIYGIANRGDVVRDKSGMVTFPMNRIVIQSERGEVLKEYRKDNVYVIDGIINHNQLTLKCIRRIGEGGEGIPQTPTPDMLEDAAKNQAEEESVSGDLAQIEELAISAQYEPIEDDHIGYNAVEEKGQNVVGTATTDTFEKIVQITLKSNVAVKNMKLASPKEVLFEGGREISLPLEENRTERYYVYGKDQVEGIYTEPAAAIKQASSISGIVLGDSGDYIWEKGNLNIKNQIMAIKETAAEDQSSVAVCLDTILEYEGVLRSSEYMLEQGQTIYSILSDSMENSQVLMLSGCSLESVLYYINQDIPVMALLDDGSAVLIIGFNELNTVIMDPSTGTIYKKGMNDSAAWFADNGNYFITYIRHQ